MRGRLGRRYYIRGAKSRNRNRPQKSWNVRTCCWKRARIIRTSTRGRRMDAANMSVFFDRLEFSCKRRGCLLPKTKEAFTTVGCSGCGGVREMPKHARRYHCEYCGLDIDRNVNSAKNVILTNLDVCEIPPTESERFVAGCCFRPGPRLLETSG